MSEDLYKAIDTIRESVKELSNCVKIHINAGELHQKTQVNILNQVKHDLENHYMTKSEIEALASQIVHKQVDMRREDITKAILRSETDIRDRIADSKREFDYKLSEVQGKAKLLAWAAATIMGVITTVLGAIATLKGLF